MRQITLQGYMLIICLLTGNHHRIIPVSYTHLDVYKRQIMDMPNTNPQTTTLEALDEKLALLAGKSAVNYSCYFVATNNNYPQFAQLDKHLSLIHSSA